MKRIELEEAIQEQSDKILNSQLIQKCRVIARDLGEGGFTSEEWASANYDFSNNSIEIHYEVYAMGDEELTVDSNSLEVFSIKERVNNPPKNPNPLIVEVDKKRFEVLLYRPGLWKQEIEKLYSKTLDITKEELADAKQRYGIVN
jgi:hypothetical protein